MSDERELDDILESIKKRREQIDQDIEPVLPPLEYKKTDDLLWIDNDDIKGKIDNGNDTLEPPKIYRQEDNSLDKKPNADVKKSKKSKKEKPVKHKKQKNDKKDKAPFELTFPKLMAIVISVIIVVAIIVCSVLYCYKNNLYAFAPNSTAYSYEKDIRNEYKERYAYDKSFMGKISIEGKVENGELYNFRNVQNGYFYNGSDIAIHQQLRSIDMSHYGDTLEGMYSSSNSYIKSPQTVTISTLFEQKNYKVIGAYYTNKSPNDNQGYVFPYTLNGTLTKQSFAEYREYLKARLLYNTGYDIRYGDEILNLCSDSDTIAPNYKFVVVCLAMDDIQNTTIVSPNPNVIYYPQSYYDLKGVTNPFKFANGLNWKPIFTFDEDETKTKTLRQQDYIEQ